MKRSIWWTPRAIKIHLTLAVLAPGFAALFWWQLNRALSGNNLSWAYAIEWPVFLVYAIFMWWRLVHDTAESAEKAETADTVKSIVSVGQAHHEASRSRRDERATRRRVAAQQRAEADDRELEAYNSYLRSLDETAETSAPAAPHEKVATPDRNDETAS